MTDLQGDGSLMENHSQNENSFYITYENGTSALFAKNPSDLIKKIDEEPGLWNKIKIGENSNEVALHEQLKKEVEILSTCEETQEEKAKRLGNVLTLSMFDFVITQKNNGDSALKYSNLKEIVSTILKEKQEKLLILFNPEQEYFTIGHSIKTMAFMMNYCSSYKDEFPNYNEVSFAMGALLHDLGKIKLRSLVISPNKLSEQDYDMIKKHTIYGYSMAQASGEKDSIILGGIHNHHRRINGTGYPSINNDLSPTKYDYLLGLIDSFEAMISTNRPYNSDKKPYTIMEALVRLKEDSINGQYDYKQWRNLIYSLGNREKVGIE